MKPYEPAEIVEIGEAQNLVLGAKPSPETDGDDPSWQEFGSLVDVDE